MYNILSFGAVPDGKTPNTQSIQTAIDACYNAGGGRVTIPAGVFVSGTLYLKSHVELHLAHGAVLKASENLEDYNPQEAYPENFWSALEGWVGKHLIIARECVDVAITGTGSFDGSADAFWGEPDVNDRYTWRFGIKSAKDKQNLRPGQLICFILCQEISVSDITIRNAPCWCVFFHGCTTVTVSGIKVHNPIDAANTDGIDIDCCQYVTVTNCLINTGDDAIAIRCDGLRLGERTQACAYITISNCVLGSSSSVFRIGVGTGSIHHVRVSNIIMTRGAVGINLQTRYGKVSIADIQHIDFSDVTGTNIAYPFSITGDVGCIKHIVLQNMRFDAIADSKISSNVDGVLEDITIRNSDLYIHAEDQPLTEKDLLSRGVDMLCVRHAAGVRLEGLRIFEDTMDTWQSKSMLHCCDEIVLKDCQIEGAFSK